MIYINSKQMAEVDRLAVKKYNLQVKQMMENAGRNVARFVKDFLKPKKVAIIYGKGNNGGDGLVAARHLAIYGIDVEIIPASFNIINEEVKQQLSILEKMGIKPKEGFSDDVNVIIDCLLGYNIKGNPKERFADLINKANQMKEKYTSIIAMDIPSGLDPNTGEFYNPYINADYTLTLALPKIGLKKSQKAGKLYLVNIGIPNELYNELGIMIKNYFKDSDVVEVN